MSARARAQAPLPSTKGDTCAVCAPLGPHTPGRHGGVLRWARRKELSVSRVPGPIEVAPGDRFIVVEDCDGMRGDDVHVAVNATGRRVAGYEEWLLRPEGNERAVARLPQLYPFFKTSAPPGANVITQDKSATPVDKKVIDKSGRVRI